MFYFVLLSAIFFFNVNRIPSQDSRKSSKVSFIYDKIHSNPPGSTKTVNILLTMLFVPLGEYDHLPEVAFYMVGDISEAVAKAERLAEEVQ